MRIIGHVSEDFLYWLFEVNNLLYLKETFVILSSEHLDAIFQMNLFPITSVQKFIEYLKLIFCNFKIFFLFSCWFSNIFDLLDFFFFFHLLDFLFYLFSRLFIIRNLIWLHWRFYFNKNINFLNHLIILFFLLIRLFIHLFLFNYLVNFNFTLKNLYNLIFNNLTLHYLFNFNNRFSLLYSRLRSLSLLTAMLFTCIPISFIFFFLMVFIVRIKP